MVDITYLLYNKNCRYLICKVFFWLDASRLHTVAEIKQGTCEEYDLLELHFSKLTSQTLWAHWCFYEHPSQKESEGMQLYLLILVSCHCCEDSLREVEGFHPISWRNWFCRRKITAEILADDMNTGLVLMHWMQDYLKKNKRIRERIIFAKYSTCHLDVQGSRAGVRLIWRKSPFSYKYASDFALCAQRKELYRIRQHFEEKYLSREKGFIAVKSGYRHVCPAGHRNIKAAAAAPFQVWEEQSWSSRHQH